MLSSVQEKIKDQYASACKIDDAATLEIENDGAVIEYAGYIDFYDQSGALTAHLKS